MAKCQFQKISESQKVFQKISESQKISKTISESQKVFQKNSESQKVFQKISECQKMLQKISESQKMLQKISESLFTSKCLSSSSSCWRARAGTQLREYGKVSCRPRPRVEAAVPRKPAGKGGRVCGMCQVQS